MGRNIGRLTIRIVPFAALAVLAACGEPEPGLETPERAQALERCDVKLAALANGETQLKRLCDCTTGRLAQQGFTLADLDNENRDRAMEQVRWCMTQSGAAPIKTPGGPDTSTDALMPEDVEEAPAEAEAVEPPVTEDAAESEPSAE